MTGDSSTLVNLFAYTGEYFGQRLVWNQTEEDDWEFAISKDENGAGFDTYMTDEFDSGFSYWQNVDMNAGYCSFKIVQDDVKEWATVFWLNIGLIEVTYSVNNVVIW